MHFDRFDIAAAYYHFTQLTIYRGMHYDYQTVSHYQLQKALQLTALLFKPGLSDRQLLTLSPNAKAIYKHLVQRQLGITSTKKA
ncbi:hypothetical protein [Egbenema bharatensis]|uniref:hypothetical protein n=1 Tax=Egbenema bharatensis TaxID=3463334 RepID=UPI003A84C8BD